MINKIRKSKFEINSEFGLRTSPFIFQGGWAGGWTIIAIPENGRRVLTYEQLKDEIRGQTSNSLPRQGGVKCQMSLPFVGGLVGFLSYDLGAKFLGVRMHAKKNTRCPEAYFAYCDRAYLKDPGGKWWYVEGGSSSGCRAATPRVEVHRTSGNGWPLWLAASPADEPRRRGAEILAWRYASRLLRGNSAATDRPSSNLTRQKYFSCIAAIKEHLYSGDTYQVNFSQQFSLHTSRAPREIFQKTTSINPSPYQFFCEDPRRGFAVISNSPELLVRGWREGDSFKVRTRPIKGTVARGITPVEERRNVRRLLTSKKDDAELTMIVDLERNDLGKVCEVGSIHVTKHRAIEKYSHVIHTASTIDGRLGAGRDVCDVIEAMFPGGSIIGCPKKRTVGIIDALEEFRRGVYCGSAGYISRCGNFEFNIMIRTMWYEKKVSLSRPGGLQGEVGGRVIFNAGGGIVVDSKPKLEYQESMQKSKALMRAVAV